MRAVPVVLLIACGSAPAPQTPHESSSPSPSSRPSPSVAKRVPIEDTEADDGQGVTVVNARGHMEKAAVEAALAPHHDALSDCYVRNVGHRRWLGGHVMIRWDIKRDGTVSSVKVMSESDLGAWPIEKCLVEVARRASFDKPVGGDADFTLPFEFSAKGATLPWSEDQALRAVGGQLGKLDACAKAAKEPAPSDVTITIYVRPHGRRSRWDSRRIDRRSEIGGRRARRRPRSRGAAGSARDDREARRALSNS